MSIRALLFDLDGVIRRWDDDQDQQVEAAAGLPRGIITEIAFAPSLLQPAITGQVTDEQWRAGIAMELQQRFPSASSAEIVQHWSASSGCVDREMLKFVQQYRQRLPVWLLTNATSRLSTDLACLGITNAFDGILNSADLGYAKPSSEIYHLALDRLRLAPSEIAYIDDTLTHVSAAAALGIHAIHYRDPAQLRESLNLALDSAEGV